MAEARTVFLTGATGFIGSRLARRLAERGDRLRCLVRASSDTSDLERLGAELVEGETTDGAALERGLEGADLAYHLAAVYDIGIVDEAALERANVGGTRAFLDAVERAGAPRAVYVSTTLALGPVAEGEGDGDEETEHPGPPYGSVYERTKVEAHRLAREAQRRGLPVIIAAPAYVYGPGDRGPGGLFIADLLAGGVPGLALDPAWYSYVHADDVAEGLELVGERGRIGESYVLSGEARSVNAFAAEVARLAGVRPPLLRFPAPLLRLTGSALDAISRLGGLRLPVTRERVEVGLHHRWLHSHGKATRELEWSPRPLAEGLPGTVAWFVQQRDRAR